MSAPKPATEATKAWLADFAKTLPPESAQDFEDAKRGFIGTVEGAVVANADGRQFWNMGRFSEWQEGKPAPDSVNPSLWRQAQLNAIHGLFEVTPGIYQVRGFDLSNITFVEGKTGYIVIDPLISAEPAAAALALMRKHRGDKPVTAVIYTHSHVDHYGGVRGVISDEDINNGLEIIAPEGFLEAAFSENVLAGNVMNRRAMYMYGALLPPGPFGHVDAGLGKTVSVGSVSIVPPTRSICETGEQLTVDGVNIHFQVTPDTEAPAEMNFFFPDHGALCMAENCSCHLHNVYTPRGAQVRDAKAWAYYIDEAKDLFVRDTEVLFASHHWPRWGQERAGDFLSKQRDLYKFVHDQTLRLANHGLTPREIAEDFRLPPSLEAEWYTRGYYGTLSHNTRAVYQRYLGFFDGNPATLNPHTPEEAGRRYVELAGGADALLPQARDAFDQGDYRWVAEIVNHLVFADPGNEEARHLQADALEQLGYRAESGPWRAFYLTGAQELRHPVAPSAVPRSGGAGTIRSVPVDNILDSLSVRLNGEKAGSHNLSFSLSVEEERFTIYVENAVMRHHEGAKDSVDAEVSTTREGLVALVMRDKTVEELLTSGIVVASDGGKTLQMFTDWLDDFDIWFGIVTP